MSEKTVLSIGQCRPDGAAITHYLQTGFSARVLSADLVESAMQQLRTHAVDLILVNRLLDADGSEGLAVIEAIRQHDEWKTIPFMLVSNYADWQQKAVSKGALYGFGKAELNRPETRERLAAALS